MFESLTAVQLARLQFGVTAMYHFLFVPLTLGLSFYWPLWKAFM